jgi:hypothetical protein
MSKSLNNFCESLVNGSNPRYIGSQPTISQQVSWQIQQQQQAINSMNISAQKAEIEWKVKAGYYVSDSTLNFYKYK